MKKKYVVSTLGCKANWVDSQALESRLQSEGWEPAARGELADLCVVNSCTVTDEADRQSRKKASRLASHHPSSTVVFTGCGAEVAPEEVLQTPGIRYVVGNQDKARLFDLVRNAAAVTSNEGAQSSSEIPSRRLGGVSAYGDLISRHPMDREWPEVESRFFARTSPHSTQTRRTRAFLKVQEGCNSFCTYCIIPYGRGPNRSLRPEVIVDQVRTLVAEGIQEVVITGTNIGDYGMDWASTPQHAELFKRILGETSLARLRVGSLDPTEISTDVVELAARDSRFCPHFHLSLQSPHSRVLRLMKRKYDSREVAACFERIASIPEREGAVFVGMDLITGFPGETSAEFDESVESLRQLPWTRMHVFPYSERKGTPATRLPNAVKPGERTRRAQVLRALSLERMEREAQRVISHWQTGPVPGQISGVLSEPLAQGPDGSTQWIAGHTSNYWKILVRITSASHFKESRNEIGTAELIPNTTAHTIKDLASGEVSILAQNWRPA